ncbi:hypothetical protein BELL_0195g00030 [Botrytis elliptica]|uniref:Uncharacterized protein n=1 Tax=Botrytis elliptica TaxID=278938 RepID=A0A4Z1JQ64_9HELO|nr:hypothetical protein EAE99_006613 [Botrytis elliptica]TGO75735.1 hypothetical protein BELL_0195g00030 [Botrytis elliptica]
MDNNDTTSIENAAAGQYSRKTPKERDVLIGTWLGSAGFGPVSDENVVGAKIDETGILKYVVHSRNTRGGVLERPFPGAQQHRGILMREASIRWYPHLKPLSVMERREYVKVRNKYESGSTIELSGADDMKAVREAQEAVRRLEYAAYQEENTTDMVPVILPRDTTHQASNFLERHSTYSSRQDSVDLERHQTKRIRFEKEKYATTTPITPTQHPTTATHNLPTALDVALLSKSVPVAPSTQVSSINIPASSKNQTQISHDATNSTNTSDSLVGPEGVSPLRTSQVHAPRHDKTIVHDGVEYSKRYNGMFQGKHVSVPSIVHLDGEDYLKYIVLTKASQF